MPLGTSKDSFKTVKKSFWGGMSGHPIKNGTKSHFGASKNEFRMSVQDYI